MATGKLIRAATFAALLASTSLIPAIPVVAQEPHEADVATTANVPVIKIAASEATSRFIPLGIGKSVAIDLPEDIKDVLVADPKIANAVIRSSRRVYMIGAAVGQTNIFFFDAKGKQIAGFDIAVTRDLNGLRAALKRTIPGANLQVQGVGDGVMLSGSVASGAEAQQAFDTCLSAWSETPARSSTASSCASAIRYCSRSRSPKCSATWSSSSASISAAPSVSCAKASSTSTPTIHSRPAVSR